ncbi:hypothetical protein GGD66_002158 [Bradyrhizobium sp. CIR48]|nr:hypothetical protein [Bradyrhizobium sp. CIR48]
MIDPKAGGGCSAPVLRSPCRAADCDLRRKTPPPVAENPCSSPKGLARRKSPAIRPTSTIKTIDARVFRSRARSARTGLMFHLGTAAYHSLPQNAAGGIAGDMNCLQSQIWQVVSFLRCLASRRECGFRACQLGEQISCRGRKPMKDRSCGCLSWLASENDLAGRVANLTNCRDIGRIQTGPRARTGRTARTVKIPKPLPRFRSCKLLLASPENML